MSEVKFACPDCRQHVACDAAYCGVRIECPGCGGTMFVPKLAAFAAPTTGELSLALPIASKAVFHPQPPPKLDFWAEKEWALHFSELSGEKPGSVPLLWILFVAPFPVALCLIAPRAGTRPIMGYFLVCAIASGFLIVKSRSQTRLGLVLGTFVYSLAILVAYAAVASGLLFAGCALLLGA